MFIILEWNGVLPDGFIGAVLKKHKLRIWNTQKEAEKWGKRNCAFNWRVVEL